MSFNKIGNGYYNNDLCKCLLSIGGAYFVELKNGVKVNISKDDYDAMADGLLSVNGVKYCDPTLVASAKHIGAKYIVEFSNGNQFSISQSDYEGLIAAGFVAIGDIYYNPDDIDKVYAVAGGYFAEMVNGQKVVMTEEEYDAIVGGDQPAGGLTPFEPDQITYGYYLNGDLSVADVDAILDQLDYSAVFHADGSLYDGCNYCRLVCFESDNKENGIGVFIVTTPGMDHPIKSIAYGPEYDGPAYFSEEVPDFAPAGWFDEDIHGVTLVLGDEIRTVQAISANAELWNGILCGANTEQPAPPAELTPFSAGQTIIGYDFGDVQNGDTSAEMDAFLTGIPAGSFTDGMYDLVG